MSVDSKREHISITTKLASALLASGDVLYDDAKLMHEDQIISLYHFDHGVLYANKNTTRSVGLRDINHFSNLTPRLIKEHREKTKNDLKVIAKSKRLRRKMEPTLRDLMALYLAIPGNAVEHIYAKRAKLRSRGFDRTLTRKF